MPRGKGCNIVNRAPSRRRRAPRLQKRRGNGAHGSRPEDLPHGSCHREKSAPTDDTALVTRLRSRLTAGVLVALTANGGDARAGSLVDPLLFFEGATESVGTLSILMQKATGAVTIEQVGDRYRFRFAMKGTLSVEEWLTPLVGARSATNELTVRRFGLRVASYRGTIRKID